MDREEKQEASVPVASRVSLVTLANLVKYWDSQAVPMKSMSQLVSWSLDAFWQVISESQVVEGPVEDIVGAHNLIEAKGLYQKSLRARSMKKVSMAIGFKNLRDEGVSPSGYAPEAYRRMHNEKSVEPMPRRAKPDLAEAMRIYREAEECDKKIAEKENAPVDMEELKRLGIVRSKNG